MVDYYRLLVFRADEKPIMAFGADFNPKELSKLTTKTENLIPVRYQHYFCAV